MTSSISRSAPTSPDRDILPGPKHIILPKYLASEHIWCEWCECHPCRNIEFEDDVLSSDSFDNICMTIGTKYFNNLHSEEPKTSKEFSPKQYIKKIRFWCYERYAKHFGLPWGRGQDAQLPPCLEAKIRMTFRQPAKDLEQWIKEPFLYQLRGLTSTYDPYGLVTGDNSRTILGKRKTEE